MNEISQQLNDKFIPFWMSLHDDRGGYFGRYKMGIIERDAPKGTILHCKILWFFSRAYQVLKDPKLKLEAEHAYKFIVANMIDRTYGGLYYSVRADGVPLDKTKHACTTAMALDAFTAYYEATGEHSALQNAYECYNALEVRFRRAIGFHEEFDRYFMPKNNEKYGAQDANRSMETMLYILQAYIDFSFVATDSTVIKALKYVYDLILLRAYDDQSESMSVYMDDVLDTDFDIIDYGRNMESSWLLFAGALALGGGDPKDMQKIRKLVDKSLEIGFDEDAMAYRQYAKKNDSDRVGWVQAETLIATINMYQLSNSDKYLNIAKKIWQYINSNLFVTSSWYYGKTKKGTVIDKPIVDENSGPFHEGRMYLEILRRGVKVGL